MGTNTIHRSSIDVSVVILTCNTKILTSECIRSVLVSRLKNYSMEIIVVDNASRDSTVKEIRKNFLTVTIIRNAKNIGFAGGNNIGIKKARGRYILLLNSDTEIRTDTIGTMIDFMEKRPKAGVSTCFIRLVNGKRDPACHRGFPAPWAAFTYFIGLESLFPKSYLFGQYHVGYMDEVQPHEVDAISGAFFLVRKEVIDTVGLLDERFFMYGEDIDWAYRIKQKGWHIWYNPHTEILHKKKQSGRVSHDAKKRRESTGYFISTMILFYQKHYQEVYGKWMTMIVCTLLRVRLWILNTLTI